MFAFTLLAAASAGDVQVGHICSGPALNAGDVCQAPNVCYQLTGPAADGTEPYAWDAKKIDQPDNKTVGYCLPAGAAAPCSAWVADATDKSGIASVCEAGQYCAVASGTGTCTALPAAGTACALPDAGNFKTGLCADTLNCLPGGDAPTCGGLKWCDAETTCGDKETCLVFKGVFETEGSGTWNWETEPVGTGATGYCMTQTTSGNDMACDAVLYAATTLNACPEGHYCTVTTTASGLATTTPTCTAFDISNTTCLWYDESKNTDADVAKAFCQAGYSCKAGTTPDEATCKKTKEGTTKTPKHASSSASKPKKATTTTTTTTTTSSGSDSDGTTSDANATTADSAVSTILGGALTTLVLLF